MNFSELYMLHKNKLIHYIKSIVHDNSISEDIYQESMFKFWKHYERYSTNNEKIYNLLLKICKNTAYDYLKKQKKYTIQDNIILEDYLQAEDKEVQMDDYRLPNQINEIVFQIEDEDLKQIYFLLLDAKLKKKEIAKTLNISERHLQRKIKKLFYIIKEKSSTYEKKS